MVGIDSSHSGGTNAQGSRWSGNGGFLDVNNNQATILADAAENIEALSVEEARAARERAAVNLSNAKDEVTKEKLESELRAMMMKERLAHIAEFKKKK